MTISAKSQNCFVNKKRYSENMTILAAMLGGYLRSNCTFGKNARYHLLFVWISSTIFKTQIVSSTTTES
jgi:hypothetical protein